jgi:transcriptional regulator with XRE-family HTH domain
MSHIATKRSSPNPQKRHHCGQAFIDAALYGAAMTLRIRALRKQKGWTQEHLASLANISRSQLAMIEKGTRTVNTIRLDAIAAALGVRAQDLFGEGDEMAKFYENVRNMDPADREVLVRMAEAFAAKRR